MVSRTVVAMALFVLIAGACFVGEGCGKKKEPTWGDVAEEMGRFRKAQQELADSLEARQARASRRAKREAASPRREKGGREADQ